MRSLFRLISWTLAVVLSLLPMHPYTWAAAQGTKEENKSASLSDLVKLYHEFGLPHPSKQARVVRKGNPRPNQLDNVTEVSEFEFAFAEPEKTAFDESWIWSGFRKTTSPYVVERYDSPPKPETVIRYLDWYDGKEPRALIFAIQCSIAGYHELASFYLRRFQRAMRAPPDLILLKAALEYWYQEFHNPQRDRVTIVAKLKQLRQRPELNSSDEDVLTFLQRKELDSYLRQLDLTLIPSKAKSQSIEAMIDALVDYSGRKKGADSDRLDSRLPRENAVRFLYFSECHSEPEMILQLSRLGFDAVPALIEHVDDQRLTRKTRELFGGDGRVSPFSVWHTESVGDVCRKILSIFFDFNENHNFSIINNEIIWNIKKSDYIKKWDSMKLKTDYELALAKSHGAHPLNQDLIVDFILHKKSNNYKIAYDDFLKRKTPEDLLCTLVQKLALSQLPKDEKLHLLHEAARHPSLLVQLEALKGLLLLDNALFSKVCMDLLEKQPLSEVRVQDRIAHLEFARLALSTDDRKVMSRLAAYGKKLPLQQRMSLLGDLGLSLPLYNRLELYYFLTQFLDDKEVCKTDNKNEYFYFSSYLCINRIEVRNFAAFQLLQAMQIERPINDQTSDQTWKNIRDLVQDEVDRVTELQEKK